MFLSLYIQENDLNITKDLYLKQFYLAAQRCPVLILNFPVLVSVLYFFSVLSPYTSAGTTFIIEGTTSAL